MSKNKLMPTIVLSTICVLVVALLAAINMFTGPAIRENQRQKLQEALLEVMPDGGLFTKLENVSGLPESVTDVFVASNGGYVIQTQAKGFKTGMIIVCGIDENGYITGTKCIKSQETNGAENILPEMYVGKTISDYETVEIIANSTKTSEGYKTAIGDAFEAYRAIKGGNE